jgi:hypothetical protein
VHGSAPTHTCSSPPLQWDCVARGTFNPDGSCRNASGLWERCAPRTPAPVPRTTLDGRPCQLPFSHAGRQVADCVVLSAAQDGPHGSCQVAGGQWARCAPAVVAASEVSAPASLCLCASVPLCLCACADLECRGCAEGCECQVVAG